MKKTEEKISSVLRNAGVWLSRGLLRESNLPWKILMGELKVKAVLNMLFEGTSNNSYKDS